MENQKAINLINNKLSKQMMTHMERITPIAKLNFKL